ncbi:MAG: glycerol-3-phosphate 1-O-acyltransferase PlsY [Chloroflexi bacterium]|nr:glycerol-3-phosphate 1-O-acyltransferase PlsY [Chloroflexota bacterium]
MTSAIAAIILSYLLGSIPVGLLVGRLFKGVDVRKYGSGKTGATNVMRTAGVLPGVLALLGDLGKAVGAVYLARLVSADNTLVAAGAALACVAGHNWPVFARFHGGRGVTTYFGGLLALTWPGAVIGGVAFVATVALTRYVSLGSLIGSLVSFGAVAYFIDRADPPLGPFIYSAVGTTLLWVLHRDNIVRLIRGKERKLGQRVEVPTFPQKGSGQSRA